MSAQVAIVAALTLPLVGALLIALAGRAPNLREGVTLATALSLFTVVATLYPRVAAGERPGIEFFEMLPGVPFGFAVEPLGLLFALIASGLWIANSLYSIGYMRGNREHHQTRFYVCFAGAIAATLGVALAANGLTLFLFYEMLTLVTYPLVTHHGTDEARRAGRVYLGVLLTTSMLFFLVALVATWFAAGTLDFTSGGILHGRIGNAATGGLLALYMFGIGKAALMPFHRWLPAAMVAPTPVSALLHAVAVVKAGVFTVVKVIVYIFGVSNIAGLASVDWLPTVAGFTIIAASIVALRADNLKRRLAYSTVSQLSYVVLAAALLTPLSVIGAALHIAAHAFGKITLFFAAGAIYTAAHKTQVSQLDGIGRRMPWTMAAFAVGVLSMIGLPPTAGFVSKWFILSGAYNSGQWTAVAVIAVSTLLTAGYFLPIVFRAFFRPVPAGDDHPHGEAPTTMVVALVATAALTVLMFFYAEVPLALARQLVEGWR
jgi:multicomponent Na+:H+ antiporter subunit D